VDERQAAVAAAATVPATSWIRRLARWEVLLAVLLLGLIWLGASLSPVFLSWRNFTNLTAAVMEVAIIALPMAVIVIVGEIDLSVEAMAGLSASVLGFLWASGTPLEIAIPIAIAVGALGGLLNGLLVASALLPSLVVTLGTLALFRGLALVVLGPRGVSGFPPVFTSFGFGTVPGTPIPWPLVVFASLAAALGIVLHRTWVGRRLFAIGKNVEASRYSGVLVTRTKIGLFVLTGMIAALAGVLLTARLASARADTGEGMTLTVITIVLLGGVDIFGGRGTIPGVVLAAFTLAVLGNALRLANISAEIQSIAIGALLIISVVIPTLARQLRSSADRALGGRHGPAGPVGPGEISTSSG
jgi:rhamnose transport system permease protein